MSGGQCLRVVQNALKSFCEGRLSSLPANHPDQLPRQRLQAEETEMAIKSLRPLIFGIDSKRMNGYFRTGRTGNRIPEKRGAELHPLKPGIDSETAKPGDRQSARNWQRWADPRLDDIIKTVSGMLDAESV